MTDESNDYPFNSWETFFEAFNAGLTTEYFNEDFPKYGKILDIYTNYDIIKSMVKEHNLDVNYGLYKYIYALCYTGTRYACESYDSNIINFFMKKGAKFPTDLLFDSSKDIFQENVKEECHTYNIRSEIIDDFAHKLNLDISGYAKWQEIEPEYIDDQNIEDEKILSDDVYDLIRFKHLKFLSTYLQKL